jgi:hypothetical protein
MESTQRVNDRATAPFALGERRDAPLDEPFVEEAFRVLWLIAEDENVAESSAD